MHDVLELIFALSPKYSRNGGRVHADLNAIHTPTTMNENKARFSCNICAKTFIFKYLLKKHYRTHTGEKPYNCHVCHKEFTQSSNLQLHLIGVHHLKDSDSLYICYYCDKPFYLKNNLKQHIRIHTGEKPYRCRVCSKRFRRAGLLSQHKRTHMKLRPFECDQCGKSFTNRTNLLNHLNRHQNVRDYVCEICGKAFIRQDGLHKHLSCFHQNQKAFTCKICNMQFKGHLRQHLRIHDKEKPYACDECGARFVQKSQLTVHQRTHTGDKPFVCPICGAAFSHSSVLKIHIRVHTGEKPFCCFVCMTSFGQLAHLRKHMRTVHKSDEPYCCTTCQVYFKCKKSLLEHREKCANTTEEENEGDGGGRISLSNMRTLLAILLKKISTTERLEKLGFGKRLIDEVLSEAIRSSGRRPFSTEDFDEKVTLLKNIDILLEWTIPKVHMHKFKQAKRSNIDILVALTQHPGSWYWRDGVKRET